MFEQIVTPRSLTEPNPAEKRRFRIRFGFGTLLFGLAVLLQLVRDYPKFPLFVHVRAVVGALMLLGVALQFWGLGARYDISDTTVLKH
jgi:hypothetical protein